ncbi:MAG: signal peptide peptidase SppA [Deltaproteobacteria bacterium]
MGLELLIVIQELVEDVCPGEYSVSPCPSVASLSYSQEIYAELKKLKAEKKVVASMGAVAASGGYYIASATDKIVANPGTITGSIGVIIQFVNAEEFLKKVGLQGRVIKSGKFKDTGSPLRDMSEEERVYLQSVIDDVHGQFIEAVSTGRGIKKEEVAKLADGRIFTGSQALKLGLVDKLGTMEDAIDLGAELAGISGKPSVVYPPEKFQWKGLLGESVTKTLGEFLPGVRFMYMMPDFSR